MGDGQSFKTSCQSWGGDRCFLFCFFFVLIFFFYLPAKTFVLVRDQDSLLRIVNVNKYHLPVIKQTTAKNPLNRQGWKEFFGSHFKLCLFKYLDTKNHELNMPVLRGKTLSAAEY